MSVVFVGALLIVAWLAVRDGLTAACAHHEYRRARHVNERAIADPRNPSAHPERSTTERGPALVGAGAELYESVVVSALLGGMLDRDDYQQMMADLAAGDQSTGIRMRYRE